MAAPQCGAEDMFTKRAKGHHSDPAPSPYYQWTLLNTSVLARSYFPLPLVHFPKSHCSLAEGKCRRAIDVSVSQKQRSWKTRSISSLSVV